MTTELAADRENATRSQPPHGGAPRSPASIEPAGIEQAYRLLLEQMRDGAALLSDDGGVIYCNQRFAALLRASPDALTGSPFGSLVAEPDRARLAALLASADAAPRREEFALLAADGDTILARLTVTAMSMDGRRGHCLVATDITRWKQDAETLAEGQLAQSIFERATDSLIVCDRQGRITHANAAAHRLCGEDLIGRNFLSTCPITPAAAPAATEPAAGGAAMLLAAALAGKTLQGMEARLTCAAAAPRHVLLGAGPLYSARQQVIGGIFTLTDITKRKQAEEALRENERRISDIAANFPGFIFRRARHPSGKLSYRYISDGVRDLFGITGDGLAGTPRTPEELIGHVVPDDRPRWREAFRSSVPTLAPVEVEGRVVYGDGSIRWLRVTARTSREADGTVIWDGVALDVTAAKRAQQALRESEDRYRLAVEAANLGAWDYNLVTGTLTWTERCKAIFNFPADTEMSYAQFLARVHPDDRDRVHGTGRRARDPQGDGVYAVDYRVAESADGPQKWVSANGKTFFGTVDGVRRPVRMIGMAIDITARKQAEEQQKLLAAELDHRVKNTLATVQALVMRTRQGSDTVDAFVEKLEGRLGATARAHNLLTRSRWSGADLHDLAAEVLAPYRRSDGANVAVSGHGVLLKPAATLSLSMILHELATNAAKYGALSVGAGRVEVCWHLDGRADGPHLVLDWRESGGPPVRAPSRSGFGCSLISRSVAYELDGVALHDFPPEGVRCRMDMPLARIASPQTVGRALERPGGARPVSATGRILGKRVLVAEDALLVAMEIEGTLRAVGCEIVGPVGSLDQAVAAARNERLDGAILDVNLGGEEVYPAADELLRRGIPLIFSTGYDAEAVLPSRYDRLPRLEKPFGFEELTQLSRDVFGS